MVQGMRSKRFIILAWLLKQEEMCITAFHIIPKNFFLTLDPKSTQVPCPMI